MQNFEMSSIFSQKLSNSFKIYKTVLFAIDIAKAKLLCHVTVNNSIFVKSKNINENA